MSSSDQHLVNRFLKSRNESDFRALYHRYADRLYRMAYFLTKKDEEASNDIIQETWIAAISKLDQFQWKSKLETWLTGILINKYREQVRKSSFSNEMTAEDILTEQTSIKIDLEQAILLLPNGYREILVMHDLEGFKHQEIAEILGITEGTSKSQLHQARKKMRTLIKAYQYDN